MHEVPNYLGGQASLSNNKLEVVNKHTGELFAKVSTATEREVELAVATASEGFLETKHLSSIDRKQILDELVLAIEARKNEIINALILEAGKTISDAELEYFRAINTIKISSEEAIRSQGEFLNLDNSKQSSNHFGIAKRVPVGPCLLMTPFNFPLNLLAHKVGPAIAAGCSFIVKPSEHTPVTSSLLAESLLETRFPKKAFSVVNTEKPLVSKMVSDDRLKLLSFTGSSKVGWSLKGKANKKKVILELGGVAICLVDKGLDLELIANKVVKGAFSQAGQSCISVQRVIVHYEVYDKFKKILIRETSALLGGDPKDKKTFISPVISKSARDNVMSKVDKAVRSGATCLCGGESNNNVISPIIMENVPANSDLLSEEVFGPVLILESMKNIDEGLLKCNKTSYGLQAGIFTENIFTAHKAFEALDFGGVIINDIPTWRNDSMPYGGVKDSGQGREGVKYAIREYTVLKNMIINTRIS